MWPHVSQNNIYIIGVWEFLLTYLFELSYLVRVIIIVIVVRIIKIIGVHLTVYPMTSFSDVSVNSWHIDGSATNTPSHHTSLVVSEWIILHGTNKRWTSIAVASVSSSFSSGANEAFVKIETVAKAGLTKRILARLEINYWKINFLQDHLIAPFFACNSRKILSLQWKEFTENWSCNLCQCFIPKTSLPHPLAKHLA